MPQIIATKPASVYEIVTSQIIKMLSLGVIPWEKEFVVGDSAPRNWLSQKEYTGINRFLLPLRGEYITEKQAKAAGGSIVDWEKNFIVTYFAMIDKRPASTPKRIPSPFRDANSSDPAKRTTPRSSMNSSIRPAPPRG